MGSHQSAPSKHKNNLVYPYIVPSTFIHEMICKRDSKVNSYPKDINGLASTHQWLNVEWENCLTLAYILTPEGKIQLLPVKVSLSQGLRRTRFMQYYPHRHNCTSRETDSRDNKGKDHNLDSDQASRQNRF